MARKLGWAALLGLLPTPAFAQVAEPARPAKYDIQLRYRISAGQEDRVRAYQAMTERLRGLGFVENPRDDDDRDAFDPTAERLTGTIPADKAAAVLDDPRIRTTLLMPAGTAAADEAARVPVRLTLAANLEGTQQRLLHEQTARQLAPLGFREGVGYDHAGFSRLRGTLPAGQLTRLLKDLRGLPGGWFVAETPPELLPLPLRNVLPIRQIELLSSLPEAAPADPAAPAPQPGPAAVPVTNPAASPKIAADARATLATPEKPLRAEVVLYGDPGASWPEARGRIRGVGEGVSVEGLVGAVVTVRLERGGDVVRIAEMPEVRAVRLPRAGTETATPPPGGTAASVDELLKSTGVARLHRAGYAGQGRSLVVLATDFAGVEKRLGGDLPAATRVVDLTAEVDPQVTAAAQPATPGPGLAAALIAHRAAPEAPLILVRLDPSAFHQLLTVARAAVGEPGDSEALQSRSLELGRRSAALAARRESVVPEYTRAKSDLSDDPKVAARRDAAIKALAQLEADDAAFQAAVGRFNALKAGVASLRGAGVVVNTLTWPAGPAQDGLSEVSRFLDARFTTQAVAYSRRLSARVPAVPLWVQPASPAVGQVWAGPFLDADGNGVLEFAPAGEKLPEGRWTRELNFLCRSGPDAVPRLLAGTRLRVTVQWREPQDPDALNPREPAFQFAARLLRQVDPAGKAVPSDEMVEEARSPDAGVKILSLPGAGAYEQTLDVTLARDGVYALRLEGRYASDSPLPGVNARPEVEPRVVLESTAPDGGRVLFGTYATANAGVGVPGDSPTALTVGVAGKPGATLTGAGPGVVLRTKPELLSAGDIAAGDARLAGPAAAAAFVGGSAASLLSAGVRGTDLVRIVGATAGQEFTLPPAWLDTLAPLRKGR